MVQFIRNYNVFFTDDSRNGCAIGHVAASQNNSGFGSFEFGETFFKFGMKFMIAGERSVAGTDAIFGNCRLNSFDNAWLNSKAEIMARAEIEFFFAIDG